MRILHSACPLDCPDACTLEVTVDRGKILKIEPLRVLVHTHWSAFSGLPDSPENYQQVTWALSEQDGKTELAVTEVNLPSEEAKTVSETGWKTVLDNLKDLLEK